MIQKILALLMMLTMLLGMTACGTDGSREQVPEAGPAAQTEPAGLTVDRPFVFLLLDNESNLPVLAGSFFENRALN